MSLLPELPEYCVKDFEKKARAMKRISLQMKKKLFDAKQRGDLIEAEKIEKVLLPRLERKV